MIDLRIEQLNLRVNGADGQEHRIQPIVQRALTVLAEEVGERWDIQERLSFVRNLEDLNVPPVNLNLSQQSDDQVANHVARAILDALAIKLKV